MSPIKVSTVLLTKNSAASLPKYLASMTEVDDIVALDGGSTDGTLDLLHATPNVRVFPQHEDFLQDGRIVDFASMRNYGYSLCRHPWIQCVDSDEAASAKLLTEVRAIVEKGEPAVYYARRLFTVDGMPVVGLGVSASDQIRLFHRAVAPGCVRPVHERVVVLPGAATGVLDETIVVPLPTAVASRPKYDRYLAIEVEKNAGISWGRWLRWLLLRNLWSTVRRCVTIVVSRLIPKPGPRYPLDLEYEQFRYIWLLTWRSCPLIGPREPSTRRTLPPPPLP